MSDYKCRDADVAALPKAKELLADKGYDADWFRAALASIAVCIPSKSNRKVAIPVTTPHSTSSATKSKTCSDGSKIGGASTPDTTAAPIPTCRQSVSPQPSPFGSDQ